jgi:uncharacterized protein DUF4203
MPELPNIDELTAGQVNGGIAAAIAIGTLYCFLGYRTLRCVLALTGFLLAGGVAAALAAWISHGQVVAIGIAAVLGGICGAFALALLYKTGVFLVGLLATLLVGVSLTAGATPVWMPWAVLGAGVLGGLVAVLMERLIMTLATAAIGAWMVVMGVGFFVLGPKVLDQAGRSGGPSQETWILIGCWAILAAAGALAQFATYRKPKVVVQEPER